MIVLGDMAKILVILKKNILWAHYVLFYKEQQSQKLTEGKTSTLDNQGHLIETYSYRELCHKQQHSGPRPSIWSTPSVCYREVCVCGVGHKITGSGIEKCQVLFCMVAGGTSFSKEAENRAVNTDQIGTYHVNGSSFHLGHAPRCVSLFSIST